MGTCAGIALSSASAYNKGEQADDGNKSLSGQLLLYRFSSNVTFLELDYPLKGAKCISYSLYNQAPKKII
jgi:hypothetical protein